MSIKSPAIVGLGTRGKSAVAAIGTSPRKRPEMLVMIEGPI
jgi:hypothetical protein